MDVNNETTDEIGFIWYAAYRMHDKIRTFPGRVRIVLEVHQAEHFLRRWSVQEAKYKSPESEFESFYRTGKSACK